MKLQLELQEFFIGPLIELNLITIVLLVGILLLQTLMITTEPSAEVQKVSDMTRKYHNHTLQTNPRQCEEEPPNTKCHKTLEWQLK